MMNKTNVEMELFAHEVIDEVYQEGRAAVDKEIDQVDDLFLLDAAK